MHHCNLSKSLGIIGEKSRKQRRRILLSGISHFRNDIVCSIKYTGITKHYYLKYNIHNTIIPTFNTVPRKLPNCDQFIQLEKGEIDPENVTSAEQAVGALHFPITRNMIDYGR